MGRSSAGERSDFAGADREKLACILYPSDSQEVAPERGSQKVDLELGRDNLASGWRPRQGCIAARSVQDARNRARMNIAVLLGKRLGEREGDVHLALRHQSDLCTDSCHEALRAEAGRDSLMKVAHRVCRADARQADAMKRRLRLTAGLGRILRM